MAYPYYTINSLKEKESHSSRVPEASSKDTSNYSNTSLETASSNNSNPPLDVTVEPLLHEARKAVGVVVVVLVVVMGGGSTSEVQGRGHRGGGRIEHNL